jgi:hypothetical protein
MKWRKGEKDWNEVEGRWAGMKWKEGDKGWN